MFANDDLEPDEHEQMGLKQAQAMRRCFSDPDMNQQQHASGPSASTPGQGQGGKVSKQRDQAVFMQPSQRNYSPAKMAAPTSKSPRLYGGVYGANDRVAMAPGAHHSPHRAPNKYNNSYSVGPNNAAAPDYEDHRQMMAPHSAP